MLNDRLGKLRKEQLEADATRIQAWVELKRCVQDVGKLAKLGKQGQEHAMS